MENNDIVAASTAYAQVQYATSQDFVNGENLHAHAAIENNFQYYLQFFDADGLKLYSRMTDREKVVFLQKVKENYNINLPNTELLQRISEYEHNLAKIVFLEGVNENIKIALGQDASTKNNAKEIFKQNQKFIKSLIEKNNTRWSDIENTLNGRINMKKQSDKVVSQKIKSSANSEKLSANFSRNMNIERRVDDNFLSDEEQTYSTHGGGDCAFHAILGEWHNNRFFCKNISCVRGRVADAIKNSHNNTIVYNKALEYLWLLITEKRNDVPELSKTILQAKNIYRELTEQNDNEVIQCKDNLQKLIENNQSIQTLIDDKLSQEDKNKNPNLIDRFFKYINDYDSQSLLDKDSKIKGAYNYYTQKTSKKITLDNLNQSKQILLQEYADLLRRSEEFGYRAGYFLLAAELELIAMVFKLNIELYVDKTATDDSGNTTKTGNKIKTMVYTYGNDLRKIYFDGVNHYEKIDQKNKYPSTISNFNTKNYNKTEINEYKLVFDYTQSLLPSKPREYINNGMYPKLVFTLGDDKIDLDLYDILQIAHELLSSHDKNGYESSNKVDINIDAPQKTVTIDYSDVDRTYQYIKKLLDAGTNFARSLCLPAYIIPGKTPTDWLKIATYFYKKNKDKHEAISWLLVGNRLLYIDNKNFIGYISDAGFINDIVEGIKEIAIKLSWVDYRGDYMKLITQDIEKLKDDYIKAIADSSFADLMKFYPEKSINEITEIVKNLKEKEYQETEWKRMLKMKSYLEKLLRKFAELNQTDENFKKHVVAALKNPSEDYQAIIKIIVLSKFQFNMNAGNADTLFPTVFSYGSVEKGDAYHDFAKAMAVYLERTDAISPQELAKIARNILKGTSDAISDEINFLPNLMAVWFVAESSRNQASILTSIILLDMIENGVRFMADDKSLYSWEYALIHPDNDPQDREKNGKNWYDGNKVQNVRIIGGSHPMTHTGSASEGRNAVQLPLNNVKLKEGNLILTWLHEHLKNMESKLPVAFELTNDPPKQDDRPKRINISIKQIDEKIRKLKKEVTNQRNNFSGENYSTEKMKKLILQKKKTELITHLINPLLNLRLSSFENYYIELNQNEIIKIVDEYFDCILNKKETDTKTSLDSNSVRSVNVVDESANEENPLLPKNNSSITKASSCADLCWLWSKCCNKRNDNITATNSLHNNISNNEKKMLALSHDSEAPPLIEISLDFIDGSDSVELNAHTQGNAPELKTDSGNDLLNKFNQEISTDAVTPMSFSGGSQAIAGNNKNSSQPHNTNLGSKTNINSTSGPNISNASLNYSFSSGYKNLTWAAQRAAALVTKPLVYAYKNTSEIKQDLYNLANTTGREGIINGLQRAARARCSFDGTSRL